MDKNHNLALVYMNYVKSINSISSLALLCFLIYSTFGLHGDSIGLAEGLISLTLVVAGWMFVLKALPVLYFILPIALEMIWHGNSMNELNIASIIATCIFLVSRIVCQVLAVKAMRHGYLDLMR